MTTIHVQDHGFPTAMEGRVQDHMHKGVLFLQRLGSAEELASVVLECVTNSYHNAETIRVDGGIHMPPK